MGTPTFHSRDTQKAKTLRNNATPAERRLWVQLARRQVAGAKFSRQMPITPYVVDFLCRERKLIVELDGHSHDLTVEADTDRAAWLESEGYHVMRFSNAEVMANIEGVVLTIAAMLADSAPAHPQPLPQAGGEVRTS